MKAENDKKDKNTSVSMTAEDFAVIKQNAQERGLKISPYLVECGVHRQDSMNPEKRAKLQNLVNRACMIVEESAPEMVDEIRKEAAEIWS